MRAAAAPAYLAFGRSQRDEGHRIHMTLARTITKRLN